MHELLGKPCDRFLAVMGPVGDELLFAYMRVEQTWLRFFFDEGVFFVGLFAPDPVDDLEDGEAYVDLLPPSSEGALRIDEFVARGGRAHIRFEGGAVVEFGEGQEGTT